MTGRECASWSLALSWRSKKPSGRFRRRACRGGTESRSGQRGANLFGDGLERCRIGPRYVGKHLAVHLDPGPFKAVNKSRVGEAFEPARRVDALDPQGPE